MRYHEIINEDVLKKDLILYHGTTSEPFDTFEPNKAAKGLTYYNPLGDGMYATNGVRFAKKFGSNVHRLVIPAGSTYKRITNRQWAQSVGRNIVMTALKQAFKNAGERINEWKYEFAEFQPELVQLLGRVSPYEGLRGAIDLIDRHFGHSIQWRFKELLPQASNTVFGKYDFVIFTDTLDYAGLGVNGKPAHEVVIFNPALQKTQGMSMSDEINAMLAQ
jgi:hypothetical protein